MTAAAARLAVDGGTPVRSTPLPTGFIGTRLLGEEEKAEVLAVLDAHALSRVSGMTPPTRVEQFERALCERTASRYALAVTSGTAALEVALAGLGIGPGDEVILPALNFISSPEAVLRLGAIPVFAEVDAGYGLDPDEIARLVTPRTRAVMPLHVHGAACRIDAVVSEARRHGLLVLENGAWSCGASFRGQAVCTFGDAGIHSLQSVKVITAGEGGVVLTGDPLVYERAFRYHDHGNLRLAAIPHSLADPDGPSSEPQLEPFVGAAFRMNELTGAVALAQLRKLDSLLDLTRRAHRAILAALRDLLPGAPFSLRDVPDPDGDCGIAVGLTFRNLDTAQRFQAALRAEGVPLSSLYGARPVYALPQLRSLRPAWTSGAPLLRDHPTIDTRDGLCPRTADLMARTLLLSVTPAYTDQDAADASAAFAKVTSHLSRS
ncbi:MAG TPA: DegT/DnrJ/EryC1/StrS family aminotransferase [Chloroflexota bacterium]|nr:DegT/DnrJ/EryC1/StrS family aminotransferase [Chloroflexota bacterium]